MTSKRKFIALLILITTSCTIQKRTVNKGYFVKWHSIQNMSVFKAKNDNNKAFQGNSEKVIAIMNSDTANNSSSAIINFDLETSQKILSDSWKSAISNKKETKNINLKALNLYKRKYILSKHTISKNKHNSTSPKKKKKKDTAILFLQISIIALCLAFLEIILSVFISLPYFSYLLVISLFGLFGIFLLLALTFFILSFFKPKEIPSPS